MSVEIRTLTVGDRKRVTQIFKKAILELKDSALENLIQSDAPVTEERTDEEQMGEAIINVAVNFLTKAIDVVDVDISEWFADLIVGCESVEAYEAMPINTETQVLAAIKEAPEAADFFTACFAFAKRTAMFETLIAKAREKFSSILSADTAETLSESLTEK